MSGSPTLKPIKEDFSLPWVRGREYVQQEGTSFFKDLRAEKGWTQDEVFELSDWILNPAIQAMLEQEWGPYLPTLDELETLAVLYGRKPGELLDEMYERKGNELIREEKLGAEILYFNDTAMKVLEHRTSTLGEATVLVEWLEGDRSCQEYTLDRLRLRPKSETD